MAVWKSLKALLVVPIDRYAMPRATWALAISAGLRSDLRITASQAAMVLSDGRLRQSDQSSASAGDARTTRATNVAGPRGACRYRVAVGRLGKGGTRPVFRKIQPDLYADAVQPTILSPC